MSIEFLNTAAAIVGGLGGFALAASLSSSNRVGALGNRGRRVAAVLMFLNFSWVALTLLALRDSAPASALIFAVFGCAVGIAASVRHLFRKVVHLRPVGWEDIGGFEFCARQGDFEVITAGIGGVIEDTEALLRLQVFNHASASLLVRNVTLRTDRKTYAGAVDGNRQELFAVAPGADERITCKFEFGRPLHEIASSADALGLEIQLGDDVREVAIPLECA